MQDHVQALQGKGTVEGGAKTDPRDARNRATSVEVREKDRNKNNRIRDIM